MSFEYSGQYFDNQEYTKSILIDALPRCIAARIAVEAYHFPWHPYLVGMSVSL